MNTLVPTPSASRMVLLDAYDTPVGNLEIIIKFDFLMADISSAPWWQNANACIADKASGKIVFASGRLQDRVKLGETGRPTGEQAAGGDRQGRRRNRLGTRHAAGTDSGLS